MKRKLLSGILAAAMVLGLVFSAFPGALVSASEENVYHTWNVGENILASIKTASENETAIAFDTIAYEGDYFGNKGIGEVVYSNDALSFIRSAESNAAAQTWRCQLEIANNRGTGEGYNTKGVKLYSAYIFAQKLTFTAPVDGKYNFVPAALGGADSITESLYAGNGDWTVAISLNGTDYEFESGITTLDVASKSAANLPEISGIELKKGETIVVSLTPADNSDDWAAGGNNITVNFDVQIVDEYASSNILLTDADTDSFSVADELQLSGTTAPVGMFKVGYVDKTGGTAAEVVAGIGSKGSEYNSAGGFTWYYGMYAGDSSYGLRAYAETDTVSVNSKYNSTQGIVITAQRKGVYTLSADSISTGGTGAISMRVETADGVKFTTSEASEGFSVEVTLNVGDQIYVIWDRNGTDWNTATLSANNLKLDVIYLTKRTEAVYETTDYDVRTELLKNNASYTTDYQDPATFTYSGKLEAAYVKSASLTAGSAWARVASDNTNVRFSNAKQGYDNNTMCVYADGQDYGLRWIYDYGDNRIGFKYVASADADLKITSGAFAGKSLNLYIYKSGEEGALTQVGDTVAVSAGATLNTTVSVTEGDVYYIVIGKASGSWNAKRDTNVPYITLSENIIVTPASETDIELEYGPDPNYEYVYKVENVNLSLTSATAKAGDEVELTLSVDQCFFGYSGFTISVPYDSEKLTVESVTAGDAIGAFGVDPVTNNNPLVLVFAKAENITGKGVIAKIKFKVNDTAAAGEIDITPVVNTLVRSLDEGGIEYITDKASVSKGTITVECDHEFGDWTVTAYPTWDTEGTRERTCTKCEAKETETMAVGVVSEVTVKTQPTNTEYNVGGTFDPAGLVVEVSYSNYSHTTEVTDFTGVEFTYDFSEAGEKTVTFTVAGKDVTVTVNVSDTTVLPGDADGDGEVNVYDVMAILQNNVGNTPAGFVEANADVNGDGVVNVYDAMEILQMTVA